MADLREAVIRALEGLEYEAWRAWQKGRLANSPDLDSLYDAWEEAYKRATGGDTPPINRNGSWPTISTAKYREWVYREDVRRGVSTD